MANASTRPPLDRLLLLEAALVALLVGMGIALYLVPAADGTHYRPAWWVAPLLTGLFFGVVALHVWRRRRGGRLRLLRAEVRERLEGEEP